MDIVSGIGAVSSALGIAQTLRGIEKTYDEATYKARVTDLINALTDAKLAMTERKEGLAAKDKEIDRLTSSFAAKAALVSGDGGYSYFADDNGNPVGYPVCPKCEQVKGRNHPDKRARKQRQLLVSGLQQRLFPRRMLTTTGQPTIRLSKTERVLNGALLCRGT